MSLIVGNDIRILKHFAQYLIWGILYPQVVIFSLLIFVGTCSSLLGRPLNKSFLLGLIIQHLAFGLPFVPLCSPRAEVQRISEIKRGKLHQSKLVAYSELDQRFISLGMQLLSLFKMIGSPGFLYGLTLVLFGYKLFFHYCLCFRYFSCEYFFESKRT